MNSTSEDTELGKFHLGNEKYAVACIFKGSTSLHIRQYSKGFKKPYPTKEGVTLTPSRFSRLSSYVDIIDEHIRRLEAGDVFEFRRHLGGEYFCDIKGGIHAINIRKYFVPNNQFMPIPTKNGISMTMEEWRNFKDKIPDIKDLSMELDNALPCFFQLSHSNQEAMFMCYECNPYGNLDLLFD